MRQNPAPPLTFLPPTLCAAKQLDYGVDDNGPADMDVPQDEQQQPGSGGGAANAAATTTATAPPATGLGANTNAGRGGGGGGGAAAGSGPGGAFYEGDDPMKLPPHGTEVFVANLPNNASEEQVRAFVAEAGLEVHSVRIPRPPPGSSSLNKG